MIRFARLPFAVFSLAALMLGSGLGGAYWHYRRVAASREAELQAALAEALERQKTLAAMIERLSDSRRLAQVIVTDQTRDTGGRIAQTEILMVELGPDEQPVGRHCFVIPGSVGFFDGLVVKFDHDAVATAHPLRGQSVALLRRVYSESMSPSDGFPIDEPGRVPEGYRTRPAPSDFERILWERFWDLCNDPKLAAQMGVRVAQGEAVYKPLRPGILYELTLDAAGGMNLISRPLPDAVAEMLLAVTPGDR